MSTGSSPRSATSSSWARSAARRSACSGAPSTTPILGAVAHHPGRPARHARWAGTSPAWSAARSGPIFQETSIRRMALRGRADSSLHRQDRRRHRLQRRGVRRACSTWRSSCTTGFYMCGRPGDHADRLAARSIAPSGRKVRRSATTSAARRRSTGARALCLRLSGQRQQRHAQLAADYNWHTERWTRAILSASWCSAARSQQYILEQPDPFGTLETLPLLAHSSVLDGARCPCCCSPSTRRIAAARSPDPRSRPPWRRGKFDPGQGNRSIIRAAGPLDRRRSPRIQIGARETQQSAVSYAPEVGLTTAGLAPVPAADGYFRAICSNNPYKMGIDSNGFVSTHHGTHLPGLAWPPEEVAGTGQGQDRMSSLSGQRRRHRP